MKQRPYIKQPSDIKAKFNLTITGFLIDYIREHGSTEPEVLLQEIERTHSTLRTKSGRTYKGDPCKTLKGALTNKKLFKIISGRVHICSETADEIEISAFHSYKPQISYEKSSCSSKKAIDIIKKFRTELEKKPETAALLYQDLPRIQGNEDIIHAARIVGHEKLIGILQGYQIAKKYFAKEVAKKQKETKLKAIEDDLSMISKRLRKIDKKI